GGRRGRRCGGGGGGRAHGGGGPGGGTAGPPRPPRRSRNSPRATCRKICGPPRTSRSRIPPAEERLGVHREHAVGVAGGQPLGGDSAHLRTCTRCTYPTERR